jgi:mono/diheme cytochrome c family protein
VRTVKTLIVLGVTAAALGLGFVYSGFYPIGADVPHNHLTYWALETLRERSVARASSAITVPALNDPEQLMSGGADYNDMCAGCHLKPGKTESDMSAGLYPKPPNLALASDPQRQDAREIAERSAARQFWIIKHGIKASAMPAWGSTHDDARIWAMVAFLQRLPSLTPEQYQILTARDPGDTMDDNNMDMKGAAPSASTTPAPSPDSASAIPVPADGPTRVVEQFQTALRSGDVKSAEAFLLPAALVYESGSVERSRAEYAARHLQEDAAFMRSASVERLTQVSDTGHDMAWIGSESRITTKANGTSSVHINTETVVLKNTSAGWKVSHIHWSSRPAAAR